MIDPRTLTKSDLGREIIFRQDCIASAELGVLYEWTSGQLILRLSGDRALTYAKPAEVSWKTGT